MENLIKKFKSCRPQTAKLKYGPEPTLEYIIKYFYTSHGVSKEQAETYTETYIKEWSK